MPKASVRTAPSKGERGHFIQSSLGRAYSVLFMRLPKLRGFCFCQWCLSPSRPPRHLGRYGYYLVNVFTENNHVPKRVSRLLCSPSKPKRSMGIIGLLESFGGGLRKPPHLFLNCSVWLHGTENGFKVSCEDKLAGQVVHISDNRGT